MSYCYHIINDDIQRLGILNSLAFDIHDPESRCSICGAKCKDIFKVDNDTVKISKSISNW